MKAADTTPTSGLSFAAVLGIAAAAALVPLNSTMIAVALPTIAADFSISTGRASFLITAYLVAMLVGQPIAGRVGDRFGNRRTVNIALIGVIVCSLAAAASTTFAVLATARVGQAGFATALGPGVQALLRAGAAPEGQGRTFGLMGSVLGVGAAAGPVIGGLLTQALGWEAIFLINVPVAAAALLVSARLDPVGTDPAHVTGDHDRLTDRGIANPTFIAAFFVQALSTLAQYALLLLTPIMLDARGWAAGTTGLVLSALTFGMILMSPRGGRLGDRIGRRTPSQVGLIVAAVAVALLLVGGAATTAVVLVVALGVFGLGFGMATPNIMAAALESVPVRRTGTAAGVLSTSRYVGSISTSIAVSIFVTADAGGTRVVLGLALAGMVGAIATSNGLPPRR